ncbi:MAG TPA: hypothetical protein ENN64_00160 [bacterium]|nr:hypothetical protein [bacterium]
MSIRFNNKNIVWIAVVGSVLVGAIIGVIVWYINSSKDLSRTDTSADELCNPDVWECGMACPDGCTRECIPSEDCHAEGTQLCRCKPAEEGGDPFCNAVGECNTNQQNASISIGNCDTSGGIVTYRISNVCYFDSETYNRLGCLCGAEYDVPECPKDSSGNYLPDEQLWYTNCRKTNYVQGEGTTSITCPPCTVGQVDGQCGGVSSCYAFCDTWRDDCIQQEESFKCDSLTVNGVKSGGLSTRIRVNDQSEQLSFSIQSSGSPSAPAHNQLCYTIGGQDDSFYQEKKYDGRVFACEDKRTCSNSPCSTNYTLTYSQMREKLLSVINGYGFSRSDIDESGIVVVSNIYHPTESNVFCSTNPGWNSGTGVLWPSLESCDGDNCLATVYLRELITNPDWDIVKTGDVKCYEEDTENAYAIVDYRIVVTYDDDGSGESGYLDRLEDEPQDSVYYSWLVGSSITPPFGVGSRDGDMLDKITWNTSAHPEWGEFAPRESKTFSYSIRIPGTHFATYYNIATGYPREGEPFQDDETVYVSCRIKPGLFDSTQGRISLAVGLIILGIVYLSVQDFEKDLFKFYWSAKDTWNEVKDRRRHIKISIRQRKERKLVNEINKHRSDFEKKVTKKID